MRELFSLLRRSPRRPEKASWTRPARSLLAALVFVACHQHGDRNGALRDPHRRHRAQMLARAATLRLLRRPFAFYSQPLAVARLRLSTSSGGSNTPPLDNVKARAAESEKRADPNAFKGMPGQSLGLPALVFLLGIVFAVNAWDDLTSKPEEATPETQRSTRREN